LNGNLKASKPVIKIAVSNKEEKILDILIAADNEIAQIGAEKLFEGQP
jgi:hypothetical protein